ncbi:MAG: rhodanese-like domain-containing protein [Candidatus Nanopelagicales bacterium]
MIPVVSVQEASSARALARGTVLDVRTPEEYAAGHVDGAVLVPLHVVPLRTSELRRSETYYIVCESGARSAQATQYLLAQGYDARSVQGGMAAWRSAGLPVASGMADAR